MFFAVNCSLAISQPASPEPGEIVKLPEPSHEGNVSVEEAIYQRKSTRNFSDRALTLDEVSQLLWAAGGSTHDGLTGPTRSYPSAGAIYPLEIYIVVGDVVGLNKGIYSYDWRRHQLELVKKGDLRDELYKAALSQRMVRTAPLTLVVTAQHAKTARRYGQRGVNRYVSMDTGHLGQNVHLQAESMGLGTVMVGAFVDKEVSRVLGTEEEMPVYIMPVGYPLKRS
ncbi:MAG: SagB/ThcOx family dehydrogenase [Candidatus Omnitrophica bacterium]|nr:SagB/ThcOx family dehydrogenase [Candidatus Omnitrophota bacterium]